MKEGNPELIKDFKKSGNLLQWIHNNGAMNLSVVVMYSIVKGAYIKYVGVGAGGFYKFFKKSFLAQETIDLNISWPSNFFRKYFMAPPINFSFLFKAYL